MRPLAYTPSETAACALEPATAPSQSIEVDCTANFPDVYALRGGTHDTIIRDPVPRSNIVLRTPSRLQKRVHTLMCCNSRRYYVGVEQDY